MRTGTRCRADSRTGTAGDAHARIHVRRDGQRVGDARRRERDAGEFGVEVTAYTAGAYALEVTLRGAVVGAFAGVTFAADRTDAASSTVTGAGLATAVAGRRRRSSSTRGTRSGIARRRRRRRLRAVTRVRGQRNPGRVGHRGGRRRRDVCWRRTSRRRLVRFDSTFFSDRIRVGVALRRRRDARGHRGGVVVRRGGCDRGRRGRKQHVRDSRRQRTRRRAGGRRRRGRRVRARRPPRGIPWVFSGRDGDASLRRGRRRVSRHGARIACVTIRTAFPSRTCSTSRSAARTFAGVLFRASETRARRRGYHRVRLVGRVG